MSKEYGRLNFQLIKPKKGWRIIPEGYQIPHKHMEYRRDLHDDEKGWWCDERRCRGTMTALWACVWGDVIAYAAKDDAVLEVAPRLSLPIDDCERCGGDHDHILFTRFVKVDKSEGMTNTHWGTCPAKKEPLMLMIG